MSRATLKASRKVLEGKIDNAGSRISTAAFCTKPQKQLRLCAKSLIKKSEQVSRSIIFTLKTATTP